MNGATQTAPMRIGPALTFDSGPSARRAKGRLFVRLARTAEEVDAALKLRYEVFNLELGEGLASAFRTGREFDEFDSDSEHVIIVDGLLQRVIGTFRLRTYENAKTTQGFYSSRQFDLSALPQEILAHAIEIGRPCVARTYRNTEAQMLFLKGLGVSLLQKNKRYLFGSLPLSTRDPMQAGRVFDQLKFEGYLHPEFRLMPKPGFKCHWYGASDGNGHGITVSSWIRTCLQFGAWLCGPPALNRQFRTIELPFLLDGKQLDEISGQD
jgi:putative hemolysin